MTTPECPVYPVMANFKDNAAVAKAFDEAMELLGNDLDVYKRQVSHLRLHCFLHEQ